MRQLIIARKDLNMSAGKLAAQVSHASISWLSWRIRDNAKVINLKDSYFYSSAIRLEKEVYEDWLCGAYTKVVCQAKNKNQLLKAVKLAEELGLEEGRDFFLIYDNCYTELEPEEEDGTTLTCIGFKPLDNSIAQTISKRYHLYI